MYSIPIITFSSMYSIPIITFSSMYNTPIITFSSSSTIQRYKEGGGMLYDASAYFRQD